MPACFRRHQFLTFTAPAAGTQSRPALARRTAPCSQGSNLILLRSAYAASLPLQRPSACQRNSTCTCSAPLRAAAASSSSLGDSPTGGPRGRQEQSCKALCRAAASVAASSNSAPGGANLRHRWGFCKRQQGQDHSTGRSTPSCRQSRWDFMWHYDAPHCLPAHGLSNHQRESMW